MCGTPYKFIGKANAKGENNRKSWVLTSLTLSLLNPLTFMRIANAFKGDNTICVPQLFYMPALST